MIFASNLSAPETPRLRDDGSWMCVECGADRGSVTHISRDGGTVRRIARTGIPNGLCLDRHGRALVAEIHPYPSLLRVAITGEIEVLMDRCGEQVFLLPNDLCFSARGLLYMTDSGMRLIDWAPGGVLRQDWAEASFDGRIYEIDLAANSARTLAAGLKFPNGIAFGPDGHLYVNEMITGEIYRFAFVEGLPNGVRERFANVLAPDWAGGFRGPDGMAFSDDGRLWCTVYGEAHVTVLDPTGAVVDRIRTAGKAPTNAAFGHAGERRLYVSEHELGQIEVFDVEAQGLQIQSGS